MFVRNVTYDAPSFQNLPQPETEPYFFCCYRFLLYIFGTIQRHRNSTELHLGTELYPDLKCIHFLHYFPLKVRKLMMWKRSRSGDRGRLFLVGSSVKRWSHLIPDILKAPEVYCSFLISSLKTTFTVCPFTTGVLMQLYHKERNRPKRFYPWAKHD